MCKIAYQRIILFVQLTAAGLLRRGQILLIGGGAAVAVSLSLLGYYTVKLVEALEGEKYSVAPESSVVISHNFTAAGQAGYLASFAGLEAAPAISIRDPSGQVVLQKTVDQPVVLETFLVTEGVHNLTLTNPSPDAVLEAGIILDSMEGILGRGTLSPEITVVFWLLLVSGAGSAVAGAVILVMDRRRFSKMKKFGDMSDLV